MDKYDRGKHNFRGKDLRAITPGYKFLGMAMSLYYRKKEINR